MFLPEHRENMFHSHETQHVILPFYWFIITIIIIIIIIIIKIFPIFSLLSLINNCRLS